MGNAVQMAYFYIDFELVYCNLNLFKLTIHLNVARLRVKTNIAIIRKT